MNDFSKDMLVEQPTIELFSELEYETANCFRGNWGKLGVGETGGHPPVV